MLKILTLVLSLSACRAYATELIPEDAYLEFNELAEKYGFKCEIHDVVTEDGYILRMFHIPGDKSRPVLLLHGIMDSSDTFIIRGNTSLALTLARAGYDVWAGNKRGSRYARRHQTLNPDTDKKFWDFSFHEVAMYDVPALVDHILDNTGQSDLIGIGHSEGNTVFVVLGALKPEYNKKIKLMISLAPTAFLYYLRGPTKTLIQTMPILDNILMMLGQEEVLARHSLEASMLQCVCSQERNTALCVSRIMMPFVGADFEEMEPEFLKVALGHYPAGASRKAGMHLIQTAFKKTFTMVDYGMIKNLEIYNSTTPPEYNLSKVTMPIAMVAGTNDAMNHIKDVRLLKRLLPNVVDFKILDHKKTNHVDYVWGKNMDKYLYPHIFYLLQKVGY